jgi:hypothetical protein
MVGFPRAAKPNWINTVARTWQHYTAKMNISRKFVIPTQGNTGSWENKGFA